MSIKPENVVKKYGKGKDYLTYEETLHFLAKHANVHINKANPNLGQLKDYELVVRLMDKDKNNKIDFSEVSKLVDKANKRKVSYFPRDLYDFAFEVIDTDDSGYLEREEVTFFIETYLQRKPCRKEVAKVIAKLDANKDGKISKDEFLEVFSPDVQKWRTTFDMYDANKDGLISQKEAANILQTISGEFTTQLKATFVVLFNLFDKGPKGGLNIVEFNKLSQLIFECSLSFSINDFYELIFDQIDTNATNEISSVQLKDFLKRQKEFVTDEEVNDFIRIIDIDGNGKINKREFVGAMHSLLALY
ncbi:calmodulin, putative [Entamoeba invadens IP1]|uniref:Calmodulin, putative n=1 Tax=Entamoeba invadens IP1 TaxID=370355 RepID=A0A0A1TZ64_ENTIV|nr:calmodulin, putative [Entamoeba invadens IP1]ELP86875.1 calmodulin, putative [Entamoeba invadens IP1]|eukprot:XP_004253646.1 calmodulin, putative [Entamoeba invadens IP1]